MSKVSDVIERSVWTLIQGGTGVATVQALGLPTWVAAPVAAGLAIVKNVLAKAAPVVETVAADVAKVAPAVSSVLPGQAGAVATTVGQVATQVAEAATEVQSPLHAG